MTDLRVHIGPLELTNPVMTASGTFGYGREFSEFYDLSILGAVVGKTITPQPREGNPPPRTVETAAGMLNSIGLANPGIDMFLREELPFLRELGTRVVVNIAGESTSDYVAMAERLDDAEGVDALELNVSCPNVHKGGMLFGQEPSAAAEVVRGVKKATALPVFVKLTPNVTSVTDVAVECANAGADALVVANTLMGLAVDWRKRRPRLGGVTGGLSGPAVKPVALRMVWQVATAVDVPVIGSGGMTSGQDVLEFLVAGATAVEIGTANFVYPTACRRILAELTDLLAQEGVVSVSELTGTLLTG